MDQEVFKWGVGQPIVNPEYFLKGESYGEWALIFFTDYVREEVERIFGLKSRIFPSIRPRNVSVRGVEVSLIYPFFGAPSTVMALEVAISGGVNKIVMLGEAASIDPAISIGNFIMVDRGLREEGTSYHYIPTGRWIEYKTALSYRLGEFIETEYGEKVKYVSIWSIDAPFRETIDKIMEYRRLGVSAIDMESTAVLALAKYRGVEVAILLTVSDEIHDGKWVTGWGRDKLIDRERKSLEIALKFIEESSG